MMLKGYFYNIFFGFTKNLTRFFLKRRAQYGLQNKITMRKNIILQLIFTFGFFCSLNSSAETVIYQHTDMLGSVVAESDENGNIISRSHYEPFGKRLEGEKEGVGYTGHVHDKELELTYMQARYYDPALGRFYSNDPVGTLEHLYSTENGIHGFNRYAYANNNPYKYIDPDGQAVCGGACVIGGGIAIARLGSAAYRAYKTYRTTSTTATIAAGTTSVLMNESADTPDLPEGLVGDQSDDRAGPNKNGTRHTSGPLTPENGGTGDYEADLEILTGGTREAGEGDSAPIGAQIGENGIFGRPENSTGGSSIDIPANGDKPHETLHYFYYY